MGEARLTPSDLTLHAVVVGWDVARYYLGRRGCECVSVSVCTIVE